jgi:methionine synthase II (cobalamin-independent)
MFATYAGGYARGPQPGQVDRLAEADLALVEGRLDEAGHRAVADDFVREVLREMGTIELGIGGDGGVREPDRARPLVDGLAGLARGEVTHLPDREVVTRPIVEGPVRWERPIFVEDWRFANAETDLFVKQTLIGPYTLAALAEPAGGRDRARLAVVLAEALNQELHALADANCPMIEIDEPLALRIGNDAREWRTFRGAHRQLTDGFGGLAAEGVAHLSLGLWGGTIDRAGYTALIELPYLSYLVDVLAGPSAWRFINALPPERGVIVGAADVQTEQLPETEALVWAMAWASRGERGSKRVGVSPNGTLALVRRHFAHRKAQRCGESVTVANAGPLWDVAVALDEHPERSWMSDLRDLAAAVAAADVA